MFVFCVSAAASTHEEVALDHLAAVSVSAPEQLYRGREAVYGATSPSTLYRLEGVARAGAWTVGVGRFLAPSVVLLPVDGARIVLDPDQLDVSPFAGRRGVSTSRTTVPWYQLLPAGGAALLRGPSGEEAVSAAAYQDLLVLGTPPGPVPDLPYTSGNVMARALFRQRGVRPSPRGDRRPLNPGRRFFQ